MTSNQEMGVLDFVMTDHAKRRWTERFPDLSPLGEWLSARRRRVGKRTLRQIQRQCPGHEVKRNFNGYYYKVSRKDVCFVVAPPRIVVTVFQYEPKKSKGKE